MKTYNIPLNCSFLEVIADFIQDNFDLNDIILLPTSRSCKILKKLLIQNSKSSSLLLPTILPLDSAQDNFIHLIEKENNKTISEFEKLFLLNTLIQKANPELKFSSCFALAKELSDILDTSTKEMISWDKLEEIKKENLSEFSKKNIEFLNIITEFYPIILKEKELTDNTKDKIQTYLSFGDYLSLYTKGKVIIAGTTASLIPTQKIIKKLSSKENFYLFLPSFDEKYLNFKEELSPTHPQYSILQLVKELDLSNFESLNYEKYKITNDEKILLMHELHKPIDQTHTWQDSKFTNKTIENITYLNAYDIEQEALCICYDIHKTIKQNKSVCVVCDNTNLMNQIIAVLNKINIPYDTSFPISFGKTLVGEIFNKLYEFISTDSLASFLNCIKTPFSIFKNTKEAEIVLRKQNITSITKHYKKLENEYKDIVKELESFLNKLIPLKEALKTSQISFNELLQINLDVIQSLYPKIWNDELSSAGKDFINKLLKETTLINSSNYITILNEFFSTESVRQTRKEEFCTILGTIEARLFKADKYILTMLNEGHFPKEKDEDPFLNERLRQILKLPSLKRKTGLQAHDFEQIFCQKEVLLTRSQKVLGTPQIQSRFIEKLEAILNFSGLKLKEFENYEQITSSDFPIEFDKVEISSYNPPLSSRPKKLYATDIEKLLEDPYGIYAKTILKLRKLDDSNEEKIHATFGNIVHKGMEEFTLNPTLTKNELIQIFDRELKLSNISLATASFLSSRFGTIANYAIELEKEFGQHKGYPEDKGEWQIIPDFTVGTKCDRINMYPNKTYDVIDYKTGTLPEKSDIKKGIKLQLVLAALIAENKGFGFIKDEEVNSLSYIKLNGIDNSKTTITKKDYEEIKAELLPKLQSMLKKYQQQETSYTTKKLDEKSYSDYKYLSRQKEL